jgi:hypothetical protein
MLWTDALFINTEDLASIDAEVSDIASAENLTVDGINGIAHRSIEESGRQLMRYLQNWSGFLAGDSLSANHLQAVFNIGLPAVQRSRVLLDNICINGLNNQFWSELKTWVVYRALVNFFRAASNRAREDRYEEKRQQYLADLTNHVWPEVRAAGIPVVYKPLAAPAALMAHDSGTWLAATADGPGTASDLFNVAVTYFDSTASRNCESHPSVAQPVPVSEGSVVTVDISGLNPPNGLGNPIDIARAIITPLNATHWNLWVGGQNAPMIRQNAAPIPITTKTFTLPGDPVASGPKVGTGQWMDQFLTIQDMIFRA